MKAASVQLDHLTKSYGGMVVVDDLSVDVEPGRITGFLGPNGAGKSTTFRLIMGLDRPTSGRALVDGRPIADWPEPGRKIGAVLSNQCAHPRRTAYDHLRWVGELLDVPAAQCREMLELVGLESVATAKTRTFSLGMMQRLALATALLGDPEILLLDEPMNGLDPEGMAWLKEMLEQLRERGRTVFVASHLLKEMEDLADDLLIIAHGKVVESGTMTEIVGRYEQSWVSVRSDDAARLGDLLQAGGAELLGPARGNKLKVSGMSLAAVSAVAREHDLSVLELSVVRDLSGVYQAVTQDRSEIRGREHRQ
ncbi:ABC transporter ATP-binding protein [Nocardioides lijunqiniae]|uniref:ABC transporter ATP-binding protein n=1 Tax=Nocardioides lijunqiniae TaxID=2760832 RepID=UPI0018782AD9|nr:ATP-binding cassette domain-containing protein [Nocardioides lijunqiniae]